MLNPCFRSLIRHLTTSTLALGLLCGLSTGDAHACGDAWFEPIRIDYRLQGIARAERDLSQGKHAHAAAAVLRMIPHIKGYNKATRDPVINRALRVLAVATTRSEGRLAVDKLVPQSLEASWSGSTASSRKDNLRFSAQTLQALEAATPKQDPRLQSELGEALARVEEKREEGRALLSKLADKDLITTPQAYAALASLRHLAGDQSGKKQALARCRAMAPEPALCLPPSKDRTG